MVHIVPPLRCRQSIKMVRDSTLHQRDPAQRRESKSVFLHRRTTNCALVLSHVHRHGEAFCGKVMQTLHLSRKLPAHVQGSLYLPSSVQQHIPFGILVRHTTTSFHILLFYYSLHRKEKKQCHPHEYHIPRQLTKEKKNQSFD